MKAINISQDIIPVGKKRPIVITQNGRPAGVLIAPEEYDKLVYNKMLTESINRGIQDIKTGNIYTTSELKNKIRESRKNGI